MDNETLSIQDAVSFALKEAEQAAKESSYGVGGMLVDARNGRIIFALHNQVIKNNKFSDPTAHGERQLVDWYFEKIYSGAKFPDPCDIIIVTTLDPCYMCTGSILAAGFKAVVAAYDDNAGINYKKDNTFEPLKGDMAILIRDKFFYPGTIDIGPDEHKRKAFGTTPKLFINNNKISPIILNKCFSTFKKGMDLARAIVEKENDVESKNPKYLDKHNPIRVNLLKAYKHALSYTSPNPYQPDKGLIPFLKEACIEDIKNKGKGNAVAFLDHFGNLLMCKPGYQAISPISTPFMETLRAYCELRSRLGKEGREYLCSTKMGTFVFYQGFDKSAVCLAELGAYGSSILGKFDNTKNLQYIVPIIPQSELEDYIGGMAKRYKDTLKPMLVEDKELAAWRFK